MPAPNRFHVISFDLDDTLWAIGPVIHQAEQRTHAWLCQHVPAFAERFSVDDLTDLRLALLDTEPALAHRISELRVVAMTRALEHSGCPPAEARRWADEAFEIFLQARHDVTFFDATLDTLETLHTTHTLGVLTNGNACVHRLGLGRFFDFVISAEAIGASKPDPAPFQRALTETGCAPEHMLHVGDHPEHDMQGAAQLGLRTVWINPTGRPWPEAGPVPDAVVAHIGELPAAVERLERTLWP